MIRMTITLILVMTIKRFRKAFTRKKKETIGIKQVELLPVYAVFQLINYYILLTSPGKDHVYSTLKRCGKDCFHVVLTWNTHGMFAVIKFHEPH